MGNEIWTERLQLLYDQTGDSYRDVSDGTGIPKSAVQRYVTGDVTNIPLDRLQKLAQYYKVNPAYLLGWTENPSIEPKSETSGNGDLMPLREQLRRQPGMRVLFDASKNATEQDLLDAAALIEGFKRRRGGEE